MVVVLYIKEENISQIFKEIKLDFQMESIFVRGDGWEAKGKTKYDSQVLGYW